MSVRKRVWTNAKGEQSAWLADYRDRDGKRRARTFPTQRAAKDWLAKTQVDLAAGTHVARSVSATVSEALEAWLAHCQKEGLEKSTVEQREQHARLHIRPQLGAVKLSDLTAPDVRAWLDRLRDGGTSLAMRRKALTTLKTGLDYAQNYGMAGQNVARSVKAPRDVRNEASEVVIPTKREIRALIENTPDDWRAFIVTAIFTGLRQSELRGLRWSHVDFDNKIVGVRARADKWGNMGPPKSKAGRRDIPLAPIVVSALKQHRAAQPVGRDGLVFANRNGRPFNPSNLHSRVYGPIQERAGLVKADGSPKYTFHALRHAAASLMIEQGWPPKKIQSILGHASIQITFDRYGHLFPSADDDQAAMARMERALLVD
ncbi:MAG: site-specific integrase [Paracoccaceae bacterium]|nr:site-specific integrase [Paracoccaceae bacterium]